MIYRESSCRFPVGILQFASDTLASELASAFFHLQVCSCSLTDFDVCICKVALKQKKERLFQDLHSE
jgi:hypothetical protein